jgi:acetylglutamate kinase
VSLDTEQNIYSNIITLAKQTMNKNCLVKLTGDLIKPSGIDMHLKIHLRDLTFTEKRHVVIVVGGGTQINRAFKKAGLPVEKFGPFGRETKSLKARQIARDVLETNQAMLQDLLQDADISAEVVIPVITSGSVLCHVNGDQYVYSVYNGFDEIHIVTKEDRVEKKQEQFKDYPKIKVIGF